MALSAPGKRFVADSMSGLSDPSSILQNAGFRFCLPIIAIKLIFTISVLAASLTVTLWYVSIRKHWRTFAIGF
jgi:hypothetical protein